MNSLPDLPNDDGVEIPAILSGAETLLRGSELPQSGQSTSRKAAQILVAKQAGFMIPSARQRQNLAVAFAKVGKVVYGKAFDIVKLNLPVNLDALEEVEANLHGIVLIEIKSTKKPFPPNFAGFFFALTAGEVLVAQSLRNQFRFAFVNTATEDHLEMALTEVFSRARGIYCFASGESGVFLS